MSSELDQLVGGLVHFPDRQGNIVEGTVRGAYLTEGEVKVVVLTRDGGFSSVWLDACKSGWMPVPDDEKKPKEKRVLR